MKIKDNLGVFPQLSIWKNLLSQKRNSEAITKLLDLDSLKWKSSEWPKINEVKEIKWMNYNTYDRLLLINKDPPNTCKIQ